MCVCVPDVNTNYHKQADHMLTSLREFDIQTVWDTHKIADQTPCDLLKTK